MSFNSMTVTPSLLSPAVCARASVAATGVKSNATNPAWSRFRMVNTSGASSACELLDYDQRGLWSAVRHQCIGSATRTRLFLRCGNQLSRNSTSTRFVGDAPNEHHGEPRHTTRHYDGGQGRCRKAQLNRP